MAISREYVELYCREISQAIERHYVASGYRISPGMIYPEYGRRFTRIVHDKGAQRFVHAFVDMTNGDVIKSAGWKAPQRGVNGLAVRFNLVDEESRERGFRAIDPYGSYLYEGVLDKKASASV